MANQPPPPPGSVPPQPGRYVTPPGASQPKPGWFSRNWKWIAGCGCLTVIGFVAVIILFIYGIFSFTMSMLKDNPAYKQAVIKVQNDPEARTLLGTPIEPGYLVTGNYRIKNNSGSANLEIPVSGPKGEGTVRVRAVCNFGQWTIQSMTLQVPGQPQVDLLNKTDPNVLEDPQGSLAPPSPQKAAKLHELGVKEYAASMQEPQRRDGAIALLEQAVLRDPDNDALVLDLAEAYVQTEHEVAIAIAIDLYEEVLESRPKDDAVIARMADAYGALGNYRTAFQWLERRLELPKPNVRGVAMQATTLTIDSGKIERGKRLLEQLAKDHPDQPGVSLLLATLLADSDRKQEARSVIEEARSRIAPNDPLAAEVPKMLERLTP